MRVQTLKNSFPTYFYFICYLVRCTLSSQDELRDYRNKWIKMIKLHPFINNSLKINIYISGVRPCGINGNDEIKRTCSVIPITLCVYFLWTVASFLSSDEPKHKHMNKPLLCIRKPPYNLIENWEECTIN